MFDALQDGSERVALRFPDRSLTYAELAGAAGRVAAGLAGSARAAVIAEPRIETAVAVVGALQAGVPAVPINPKSGSSELSHIASDAAADVLLTAPGAEVPAALAGLRRVVVDLDDAATDAASAAGAGPGPAPWPGPATRR